MANRGQQSFKKRQKEQQRKERQQEKFAKRLERKRNPQEPAAEDEPSSTPVDSAQNSAQV